MAVDFSEETTISENPFLDILIKDLKVLTYNCIVKDEYEADRNETPESLKESIVYMACMDNTVTLSMFAEIGIPGEILHSVGLSKDIIKLFSNFGNATEFIPKDVLPQYDDEGNITNASKVSLYRTKLLSKLKPWFLNNYDEKNNYYRMICGLPPYGEFGIPMRDYDMYLPSYFTYQGEYLHEIGIDNIRELETLGILDIIKMEHPDDKYLHYILAGLSIYEARRKEDFQLLWVPEDYVNDAIKIEFETKFAIVREFIIKTIYSSAMEIESEYYHKFMIVFLLITVMLDMIAELQTHIIKKDILDRRCVEYIFSIYGIPYYKNIPYKYQQKLCDNLHDLIKYKSCTKEITNLYQLFGFDDIEIFKYYLLKVRKTDEDGNFKYTAERILVSNENDILIHDYIEEIVDEPFSNPGYPEDYIGDQDEEPLEIEYPYDEDFDMVPNHVTTVISYIDTTSGEELPNTDTIPADTLEDDPITIDNNNETSLFFFEESGIYTISDPDDPEEDPFFALESDLTVFNVTVSSAIDRDVYINITTTDETDLNGESESRYIKYPFDYYREKGNALLVILDDIILNEGTDYIIYKYNRIKILSDLLQESSHIRYEFFYDKSTIDLSLAEIKKNAKDNVLHTKIVKLDVPYGERTVSISDEMSLYNSYLYLKDKILVSVGSNILTYSEYELDLDSYTITINDSVDLYNKDVYLIFIDSKYIDLRLMTKKIIVSEDNLREFDLLEPYPGYLTSLDPSLDEEVIKANSLYVRLNDRLQIQDVDYTLDIHVEYANSKIRFNKNLSKDDVISLNYLYSASSFVNRIYLKTKNITLTATDDYQTEFPIEFPISNYIGSGYKIYAKIGNDWLNPVDSFSCTNNLNVLVNENLALLKGQTIDITLIYCEKDRTDKQYSNIEISSEKIKPTVTNQSEFQLNFPILRFNYSKYNDIVVDVDGKYLEPSKYKIDYYYKTLTILNDNDKPFMSQSVRVTYFYNKDDGMRIHHRIQQIPYSEVLETNKISYLSDYDIADEDILIFMGSKLISSDDIILNNDNTFSIKDIESLIISDLQLQILSISSNDYRLNNHYIDIIYIRSDYNDIDRDIHTEFIIDKKKVDIKDSDQYLEIPEPVKNYIENEYPYIVAYETSDNRLHILYENEYDIINGKFYTNPVSDLQEISPTYKKVIDPESGETDYKEIRKYGDSIYFIFAYKLKDNYIYYDYIEDYEEDIKLEFCRIPLSAGDNITEYMIDESNWIDYDVMIISDKWWTGIDYRDDYANILKNKIYEQDFNYIRTKYYGISQLIDFNKFVNQTSLFYSMWYDDSEFENDIEIVIPTLSSKYKFRVSYLFLYMTCLTYIYNGQEPIIITDPIELSLATGFNFKADLNSIKNNLEDKYGSDNIYYNTIREFKLPTHYDGNSGEEKLEDFINTFTNNVEIRDSIIKRMLESESIHEYREWKSLYDNLLVWDFNVKYFNIEYTDIDGQTKTRHANTYREFLEYKDEILYRNLLNIEGIKDNDTRADTITKQIDDICYTLQDYFTSIDYIFTDYQNKSFSNASSYLLQMINFFKSYKIIMQDPSMILNLSFDNKTDLEYIYTTYDDYKINNITTYKEYIPIIDDYSISISTDFEISFTLS